MVKAPSGHDDDNNLANDFAPEQPAVESRHADLESVVLWLADGWRESKRVRSSFAGILILLVVAGAGLFWWGNQPAAPGSQGLEPIASARVERLPIEAPVIVPSTALSSDAELALPDPIASVLGLVDRDVPPIPAEKPASGEKPPSARPQRASTSTSPKVAERPSPAAAAPAASRVSPPIPAPATVSAPIPSPPVEIREEEPTPVRTAVVEPPPPPTAKAASKSPGGFTTWDTSRSGTEDPENGAIQDVLGRYRSAFGALDVAAVQQVWPSVNQRSLERAFRQLEGQEVSFFSCTLDVKGPRADASCVGTTNFIPKVGNRSPQSGPSQWNFKLSKRSAGGWLIDDAQAR